MANKQEITRVYKDIDMSFKVNALSGDIGKKLDGNSVKQSLMNLLMIAPYERKFHPEKGSPLANLLFENMTPGLEQTIKIAIKQVIENFEPRVRIVDVDVTANYDHERYDITLRYYVVGVDEPQALSLNLTRLR